MTSMESLQCSISPEHLLPGSHAENSWFLKIAAPGRPVLRFRQRTLLTQEDCPNPIPQSEKCYTTLHNPAVQLLCVPCGTTRPVCSIHGWMVATLKGTQTSCPPVTERENMLFLPSWTLPGILGQYFKTRFCTSYYFYWTVWLMFHRLLIKLFMTIRPCSHNGSKLPIYRRNM